MNSKKLLKRLIIAIYILLFMLTVIFISLFVTSYLSINSLFIDEIEDSLSKLDLVKQTNEAIYESGLIAIFNTSDINIINIFKNIEISSLFFLSLYGLIVLMYFSLWCYFWITKSSSFLNSHKELIVKWKEKWKKGSEKFKKKMKKTSKFIRKIK